MKNLSYIAVASIILLCNLDLTASPKKSPCIANYISPNKQDYIDGHFIYRRCQKPYYKHHFPDMNGEGTYYKANETAASKIQAEYQEALKISQSKADKYKENLIEIGFLKGSKTIVTTTPVLPIPTTSPQQSSMRAFSPTGSLSSEKDDDTNTSSVGSYTTTYSRRSTPPRFSPTQYLSSEQTSAPYSPEIDQTAQENLEKRDIIEGGLILWLQQYQPARNNHYSLFPK